ncbi:MAG: hypothetical protein KGH63_04695, partial [Candidatus Micrarchaeota archaeon]|nr:hypothetical protein [Candidatus Micrarchaeota archaeon]
RHRAHRSIEGHAHPKAPRTHLSDKKNRFYEKVERARMEITERQMTVAEEKNLRWRLSQIEDTIQHAEFHKLDHTILESIGEVHNAIRAFPHKSGHHFAPMAEGNMR